MRFIKKKLPLATLLVLAAPLASRAADSNDTMGHYSVTLMTLASLIVILAFIIGALAYVMNQLAAVLKDKNRKEKKGGIAGKATLLLLMLTIAGIQAFAADAAEAPAPVVNYISGVSNDDFYLVVGVLMFELLIIFGQVGIIRWLLIALKAKPEDELVAEKAPEKSWFWDKFNAAASMEQEKDIMLDHDYDGIRELDNSLPPWWKYGFYLTIVIGVIYLYRFHISHDGPSSEQEYQIAMQEAEAEKAAYLANAANNVDENTVEALTDPASLAAGKDMFVKTCAACHLADGGGSVGPNLTDKYWLHGGSIKDIFKSIKYGWQDKGMKSWKDDFSPKQIHEIASFVKSLNGTHPATPKDPQGELYVEAQQVAAADSTTAPAQ